MNTRSTFTTTILGFITALTLTYAQNAYAQNATTSSEQASTPTDLTIASQWVEIFAPELTPHKLYYDTTSIKPNTDNPNWREVSIMRTPQAPEYLDNTPEDTKNLITQSLLIELTLDCQQRTARTNFIHEYNAINIQGQRLYTSTKADPSFTPATYPSENHLISKVCSFNTSAP